MDLRDKLRQIESLRIKSSRAEETGFRSLSSSYFESPQPINGFQTSNPLGSFFCHQTDLPAHYRHGNIEIASLLTKPSALLAAISLDQIPEKINLKNILFLDTETSGVSGGSGMFAFLVGLGYFTEDGFRIQQFFLDDIKNEGALLYELNRVLENHEIIITYNGKTFDAPLLESRFIFHRFKTTLTSRLHLDLLHCARRIWRRCLPDCTLTTIESQILKHQRTADVPSYLIPQIYFDYLQERDLRALRPVFYHNREDVLAMMAILARLLDLVENPHQSENAWEIWSLAKMFENRLQYERAIELYAVLQNSSERHLRREALVRTAFNYKRLEKWAQAAEMWERYLSSESYHPLPYIELAKHYEHRQRELAMAKKLVDKALAELNVMLELGRKRDWLIYKDDLEYRRQRIIRKLNSRAQAGVNLSDASGFDL